MENVVVASSKMYNDPTQRCSSAAQLLHYFLDEHTVGNNGSSGRMPDGIKLLHTNLTLS